MSPLLWLLLGVVVGTVGGPPGLRSAGAAASVVGAMLAGFVVAALTRASILGIEPVSSLAALVGALMFLALLRSLPPRDELTL